jgi:hypothetical protein
VGKKFKHRDEDKIVSLSTKQLAQKQDNEFGKQQAPKLDMKPKHGCSR